MSFLLLGIDSLIACIAIGALVEPQWRLRLAALFGVADGAGFIIGVGLGLRFSTGVAEVVELGALVALGIYLLVVAARMQKVAATWPVWVLPWALAVDNLTFGAVSEHSGSVLAAAGEQAVSSALLAFVGLMVAVVVPRFVPAMERRDAAAWVSGGALIVAAAGLTLVG